MSVEAVQELYEALVPAVLHSNETEVMIVRVSGHIEAAEMWDLRFTCGITKYDRMRRERTGHFNGG